MINQSFLVLHSLLRNRRSLPFLSQSPEDLSQSPEDLSQNPEDLRVPRIGHATVVVPHRLRKEARRRPRRGTTVVEEAVALAELVPDTDAALKKHSHSH